MNSREKFDCKDAYNLCVDEAHKSMILLQKNELEIFGNYVDDDIQIKKIGASFFSSFGVTDANSIEKKRKASSAAIEGARNKKLAATLMRVLARHVAISPIDSNGGASQQKSNTWRGFGAG